LEPGFFARKNVLSQIAGVGRLKMHQLVFSLQKQLVCLQTLTVRDRRLMCERLFDSDGKGVFISGMVCCLQACSCLPSLTLDWTETSTHEQTSCWSVSPIFAFPALLANGTVTVRQT
jgi:hypothetical protein